MNIMRNLFLFAIQFRNTSLSVKSNSDSEILIKVNMAECENIKKIPSDL